MAYCATLISIFLALPACSGRARAKSHNALGEALLKKKDLKGAKEAFDRAVVEWPEFSTAFKNLGLVQLEQGDKRGALESLGRAVDLDPTDADTLARRGLLALDLSEFPRAAEDCKKASEINKSLQPAFVCHCMSSAGTQPAEARKSCDRAIQLDSKSVPFAVFAIAARLAEDAKDFDAAIVSYQDLLRVKPEVTEAYPRLAHLLEAAKEPDKAFAVLERGASLAPTSGVLQARAAELAFKLGQIEKAKKYLEAAIAARESVDLELRAAIENAKTPGSSGPTK